jgi:hypothetical protein
VKAFENRVLNRIFGPKGDEITGWRKLHNDGLHNMYSSPDRIATSRKMRPTGYVAGMAEKKKAFWWESLKKRNHYRDIDITGKTLLKWIHLAQDRDQWMIPVNIAMKFRARCTVGLSRRTQPQGSS